jgi:hypothetical protein
MSNFNDLSTRPPKAVRDLLNGIDADTIIVSLDGQRVRVKIIKKINQGFHATHNHDGQFLKMWALGVDKKVYRTTSHGGGYRLMQDSETAPPELFK